MADRRAGKKQGPYVPSEHGGKQPRDRNQDGTWLASWCALVRLGSLILVERAEGRWPRRRHRRWAAT
jgi:hypothetical protein